MSWGAHLPILPIALPLAAGALMLLIDEKRPSVKAAIGAASLAALPACAIALVDAADGPSPLVYALGGWPAPFGIVLVADRLAAVMVLLATLLAIASFVFSLARWHSAPGRFPALLQFLLLGAQPDFRRALQFDHALEGP